MTNTKNTKAQRLAQAITLVQTARQALTEAHEALMSLGMVASAEGIIAAGDQLAIEADSLEEWAAQ